MVAKKTNKYSGQAFFTADHGWLTSTQLVSKTDTDVNDYKLVRALTPVSHGAVALFYHPLKTHG